MKAAIYCRVSTEDQEREGTSLISQREACLAKAKELGWEAPEVLKEVKSGLTLERPLLDKLREWIKNKEIAGLICYSTDRLSRDPLHLLLIAEECEKANVELVFVTEPMDNSMEGQLLGYVRGWASKLEALKIRERSGRGRKQRASNGRLTCGGGNKLFGYDYIAGKGIGEGVRVKNSKEAGIVTSIFDWFANEYLTLNGIITRLYSLGIKSPTGNDVWCKATLQKMLRQTAYIGKTYAFNGSVELPDATPAIVDIATFEKAQARLERNKELARRNRKREYLLSGYAICGECGRRCVGGMRANKTKSGRNYHPFYHCTKSAKNQYIEPCRNRTFSADMLDNLVWQQVENVLANPSMVMAIKNDKEKNSYQVELEKVKNRLERAEKEKDRIWTAFRIVGDEEKFTSEIKPIMNSIKELENRKADLERRIEAIEKAEISIDAIENACQIVQDNLGNITFETKRLALEVLNIRAYLYKDTVRIEGILPVPQEVIESIASRRYEHNILPFSIPVRVGV